MRAGWDIVGLRPKEKKGDSKKRAAEMN